MTEHHYNLLQDPASYYIKEQSFQSCHQKFKNELYKILMNIPVLHP